MRREAETQAALDAALAENRRLENRTGGRVFADGFSRLVFAIPLCAIERNGQEIQDETGSPGGSASEASP